MTTNDVERGRDPGRTSEKEKQLNKKMLYFSITIVRKISLIWINFSINIFSKCFFN